MPSRQTCGYCANEPTWAQHPPGFRQMHVHGIFWKSCSTRKTSTSMKRSTALSYQSPSALIVCGTNSSYAKEAYRLCREEGSGIKSALWTTIENTEHRMIHWLQLISIANSRPGAGDNAALEHKVNDLITVFEQPLPSSQVLHRLLFAAQHPRQSSDDLLSYLFSPFSSDSHFLPRSVTTILLTTLLAG